MVHHILEQAGVLRPVEVMTAVERRRRWSAADKARIVAASFAHGVTVSEIARRNDISPQHLHQWRRAARSGRLVLPLEDDLAFAPVVLNERRSEQAPLELEIAGAVIRVRPDTDLRLMTVVIQALKGSA